MDQNLSALERAFALARSGRCSSLSDIKHQLKIEGYATGLIVGPYLTKQLRQLMVEASPPRDAVPS